MLNRRKTTTWTTKSMFNRKLLATDTIGRQQWWLPAISKTQGISKSSLKPWSVRGRVVTQLEEPFSGDSMMDLCNDDDSMGSKASRELMIDC